MKNSRTLVAAAVIFALHFQGGSVVRSIQVLQKRGTVVAVGVPLSVAPIAVWKT